MEPEVINYIKAATKFGLNDFEIKQNLLNEGWEAQVIEESLAHVRAERTKPLQNKDEDMKFQQAAKTDQLPSQPASTTGSANITTQTGSIKEVVATNKLKLFLSNPKFWVIISVFAVLCAGAYGYYFYIAKSPQKVWQKFLAASQDAIYQTAFTLKYVDQLGADGQTEPFQLSLSSQAYINGQKPDHIQSDNQVTIGFSNGGNEFNKEIKFKIDGDDLYINFGNLLGAGAFSSEGNGQGTSWIKLNLAKLQTVSGTNDAEYSQTLNELINFQKDFKTELEGIWKLSDFVKLDGLVGKDEINGVKTFHFKNRLDKQALKLATSRTSTSLQNLLTKTMQQNGQKPTGQESLSQMSEIVNQLIDKIEIKRFETWIGAADAKLYRLELVSSAPSLNDLNGNQDLAALIPGVGAARAKARDAKRLADIQQLATALELYYNDKAGYPAATQGVPDGLKQYYLYEFPQAPAPPDGNCSQYYNTYWYEGKGQPKVTNGITLYPDYELTFCLGQETGGYKAGIAKLTSKGIESGIVCPGADVNCMREGPLVINNADVASLLEKLNFGAEISVNLTYSNYGQNKNIDFPTDAVDFLKALNDTQFKNRDGQRLADIRMLASALELYFNNSYRYPNSLQELSPTYLLTLPSAPQPPDGSCSADENQYTYRLINQNEYVLTFCLGATTGPYKAGLHTLSPGGIK